MNKLIKTIVLLLLPIGIMQCSTKSNIDLGGHWNVRLDPENAGISEGWYLQFQGEEIRLPGSLDENGIGYDIDTDTKWIGQIVDSSWFYSDKYKKYRQPGNIKIPFWLQPEKHFVGAAWYQKVVDIPVQWNYKNIHLFLERCHWETMVWIDSIFIGKQNALAAPHEYELSEALSPGKHTLSIRVDNSVGDIDVGMNAHSISDHTQGSWNGISGKMELRATGNIFVEDLQLYPNPVDNSVKVNFLLKNTSRSAKKVIISLRAVPQFPSTGNNPVEQSWETLIEVADTKKELNYRMGSAMQLWDEFNPNLYEMQLKVSTSEGYEYTEEVTFGMREFKVENSYFTMNGKRAFLRGTLDCAAYPKTGYPPTDTASWLEIFRMIKSHGLNHVRYHSWCPPEAAFSAADIAGVYLQVECSSWANSGSSIGDGLPVDQFIYDEGDRILKYYGNHPSFCILLYGNEPAGKNQDTWLGELIEYWKAKDPRHVYSGGAGWPVIPENEFNNIPSPRIQRWGEGLNSIINAEAPNTMFDWSDRISAYSVPTVSHEIGQWCVYPDLNENSRYTGNLKAKNFDIFRETLKESGLVHLADSFLFASGKLQGLCYKADIEAALRTPGFAGFQLLGLSDFPGQGTALVGVLNVFWKKKGYISPEEFKMFSGATVPLARLPKMIYSNRDTLKAEIEIAHFGAETLKSVHPKWTLIDKDENIFASGFLPVTDLALGNTIKLGTVNQALTGIGKAEKLTLNVTVDGYANSWDIWVYPEIVQNDVASDIMVSQKLTDEVVAHLTQGGTVLLTPERGSVKPEYGGDIAVGFSSIFWNTAWTHGQAPHTLGILCNPNHPAFQNFPTEYHSNWQWWDAMSHSNAINIGKISAEIDPLVRIIDDWFENRSLGLIFEARVGDGRIIMTGIDLLTEIEKRPEAKQLLYSLKIYMAGDSFNPKMKLDIDLLRSVFSDSQN